MAWEDKLKPFVGIAPEFDSAKIAATAQKAGVKPDVVLDGLLRNHPKILRTAQAAGVKPEVVVNGILAKAQTVAPRKDAVQENPPQAGGDLQAETQALYNAARKELGGTLEGVTAEVGGKVVAQAGQARPVVKPSKYVPRVETGLSVYPPDYTPEEEAAMARSQAANAKAFASDLPFVPPDAKDAALLASAKVKAQNPKLKIAETRADVNDMLDRLDRDIARLSAERPKEPAAPVYRPSYSADLAPTMEERDAAMAQAPRPQVDRKAITAGAQSLEELRQARADLHNFRNMLEVVESGRSTEKQMRDLWNAVIGKQLAVGGAQWNPMLGLIGSKAALVAAMMPQAVAQKLANENEREKLAAGSLGALVGMVVGQPAAGFVIGEEAAAARQAAARKRLADKAIDFPDDTDAKAEVTATVGEQMADLPWDYQVMRSLVDMPEYMVGFGGKAQLAGVTIPGLLKSANVFKRAGNALLAGTKMTLSSPSVLANTIDGTRAKFAPYVPDDDSQVMAELQSYGDHWASAFLKALGKEEVENVFEIGAAGLWRESGVADDAAKAAIESAKKKTVFSILARKFGVTKALQTVRNFARAAGVGASDNAALNALQEATEEVGGIVLNPLIETGKLAKPADMLSEFGVAAAAAAAWGSMMTGGSGKAARVAPKASATLSGAAKTAGEERPAEPPTSPVVERPQAEGSGQPSAPESPVATPPSPADDYSREEAYREELKRRREQGEGQRPDTEAMAQTPPTEETMDEMARKYEPEKPAETTKPAAPSAQDAQQRLLAVNADFFEKAYGSAMNPNPVGMSKQKADELAAELERRGWTDIKTIETGLGWNISEAKRPTPRAGGPVELRAGTRQAAFLTDNPTASKILQEVLNDKPELRLLHDELLRKGGEPVDRARATADRRKLAEGVRGSQLWSKGNEGYRAAEDKLTQVGLAQVRKQLRDGLIDGAVALQVADAYDKARFDREKNAVAGSRYAPLSGELEGDTGAAVSPSGDVLVGLWADAKHIHHEILHRRYNGSQDRATLRDEALRVGKTIVDSGFPAAKKLAETIDRVAQESGGVLSEQQYAEIYASALADAVPETEYRPMAVAAHLVASKSPALADLFANEAWAWRGTYSVPHAKRVHGDRSQGISLFAGLDPTATVRELSSDTFKKWFGDWEKTAKSEWTYEPSPSSVVVDEYGRPKPVYHGTIGKDFLIFGNLGDRTRAPSAREGFFFSDDPDVSGTYATGEFEKRIQESPPLARRKVEDAEWNAERARNAIPSAVENEEEGGWTGRITTYDMWGSEYSYDADDFVYDTEQEAIDAATAAIDKEVADAEKAYSTAWDERQEEVAKLSTGARTIPVYLNIRNPLVEDFRGEEYRERPFSEIIAQAKGEGRDGVIFENVHDALLPGAPSSTVYVVFKPTQIKSVWNRGTWSRRTGNILHSGVNPLDAYRAILADLGESTDGTLADLRTRVRGLYAMPHLAGMPDEQFDKWAQGFAERKGWIEPTLEGEPEDAEGEKPAKEAKPVFGAGWGDRKKAAPGNIVKFADGSREGEWTVTERKGSTVLLTPYTKDRFRGKEKAVKQVKAKLSQLAVVKTNPQAKDRRLDKLAEKGILPPTTKGEWRSLATRMDKKIEDGGITRGEWSELVHSTVGWKELPAGDFVSTKTEKFVVKYAEKIAELGQTGADAIEQAAKARAAAKDIPDYSESKQAKGNLVEFIADRSAWRLINSLEKMFGANTDFAEFLMDILRYGANRVTGAYMGPGGRAQSDQLIMAKDLAYKQALVDAGLATEKDVKQTVLPLKVRLAINEADNRGITVRLQDAKTPTGKQVIAKVFPAWSLGWLYTQMQDAQTGPEMREKAKNGKLPIQIDGQRSEIIISERDLDALLDATPKEQRILADAAIATGREIFARPMVTTGIEQGDSWAKGVNPESPHAPRARTYDATEESLEDYNPIRGELRRLSAASLTQLQERTENERPYLLMHPNSIWYGTFEAAARYTGHRIPGTLVRAILNDPKVVAAGKLRAKDYEILRKEIDKQLDDYELPNRHQTDETSRFWRKLFRLLIVGKLGLNPITNAIQMLSGGSALATMPFEVWPYWVKALDPTVRKREGLIPFSEYVDAKPFFYRRYKMLKPFEFGVQAQMEGGPPASSKVKTIHQYQAEKSTEGLRTADYKTVAFLKDAYELYHRAKAKKEGRKMGRTQLMNTVASDLERQVGDSQASKDELDRTSVTISAEKSDIAYGIQMFMTEQMKAAGNIRRFWAVYREGPHTVKRLANAILRTSIVLLVNGLGVTALRYGLRIGLNLIGAVIASLLAGEPDEIMPNIKRVLKYEFGTKKPAPWWVTEAIQSALGSVFPVGMAVAAVPLEGVKALANAALIKDKKTGKHNFRTQARRAGNLADNWIVSVATSAAKGVELFTSRPDANASQKKQDAWKLRATDWVLRTFGDVGSGMGIATSAPTIILRELLLEPRIGIMQMKEEERGEALLRELGVSEEELRQMVQESASFLESMGQPAKETDEGLGDQGF